MLCRQELPLSPFIHAPKDNDPHDASTVCHELRSLCPRNAKVINIEVHRGRPSAEHGTA